MLGVSSAAFFVSRSVSLQPLQSRSTSSGDLAEAEFALKRRFFALWGGTGVAALCVGALAAVLAHRSTRPVLAAAAASNTIVNRLRREEIGTRDRVAGQDELRALEANIDLIDGRLPDLLREEEAEAERVQVFTDITRKVRESLSEADVFKTTVKELRHALVADRVLILQFDARWDGTIVAESVGAGLPKALWAQLEDPIFHEGGYVEQYRNGRIKATHDVYRENLTDCHLGLLERFAVRANLVTPIVRNNRLFGLLIAHQCSGPRVWQQPEIDLCGKVAVQVGYALDHARLLEALDTKAEQTQQIAASTRRIWASLNEVDILSATVTEARAALNTDRTIVLALDPNGNGTVVAESVAPNWPKTLQARIPDSCFTAGGDGRSLREDYRNGRVRATENVYLADLSDCHVDMLERYGVKASLVAPIVQGEQLYGLAIAHACSGPRAWQQFEVELLAQLASQAGYALEKASLLRQVDAEARLSLQLADVTQRIRRTLNEEEILQTAVDEMRRILVADRVVFYSLEPQSRGRIAAESAAPGWPRTLGTTIVDPCFDDSYRERFRNGYVRAIDNVSAAGITPCYAETLGRIAVKANLVAPVLRGGDPLGLLVAHQCSGPRTWQQPEIRWFAQIAAQVGFSLDQSRLLAHIDAEGVRMELLTYIIHRIRESLNEADILSTVVEEARKAIRADRVVVYIFNSNWSGYIAAESVIPGWPHALAHKIEDACIPQALRTAYLEGRVVPTSNVFEAGFHPEHLQLMERLQIQANLVVPILKDKKLFGLLIAHQCAGTRHWQQPEIDFFTQLAAQVGFALDHARLLEQVDRAYQSSEREMHQQRQHQAAFHEQMAAALQEGQSAVATLSTQTLGRMEAVKAAYDHLRSAAITAKEMTASVQQSVSQGQQIDRAMQAGQEAALRAVACNANLRDVVLSAAETLTSLENPAQTLSAVTSPIGSAISQIKFQAMNATLEAARAGEAGQAFAAIAEKIHELARQLDAQIAELQPLAATIHSGTQSLSTAIGTSTDRAIAGLQEVEATQQQLEQLATTTHQMNALLQEVVRTADNRDQSAVTASEVILDVADVVSRTSEQTTILSEVFQRLEAVIRNIQS
jgi:GAF domain-containing protein